MNTTRFNNNNNNNNKSIIVKFDTLICTVVASYADMYFFKSRYQVSFFVGFFFL